MGGKIIMTVAQAEADRKAWEELRKHGIGGSDAACIMGYNPWKSAYALWCEKTGKVEPEDLSNNEYVYWGTVLEQAVADRFCEVTGKKVKRCGTLADEHDEYLMANVDRLVVGENAGLECKTANGFKAKEWDGDELPDSYYCQIQHYMAVTGCEKWYIACLIGGNHFVWKEVPRNEDFIRDMRERECAFWVNNVCQNVPPEIDGSDSTEECLRKQYDAPQDNTVMLDSRAGQLIARMDELTATKKLLEEQLKECQNGLQAALGNCEVGLFNDRKVTWKQTAGRVTIDSKKLKEELPDVYQKYAKVGKPSRRFILK